MWIALIVVACSALASTACSRQPDTEEHVRKALDQAEIENVDVLVDDEGNLIHLSGTVETLTDRTRAEEVAAAAVGTSGRVVNDLTVEALEETPTDPDEQTIAQLDTLIDRDRVLRERDINFDVADGAVTITGEVRTATEKARVTRIVEGATGVAQVTNSLVVVRQP